MRKVKLDVTQDNLVDFHHVLPMIGAGEAFSFEVGKWDSPQIEKLEFSDFRANSTPLNPKGANPVAFGRPVAASGQAKTWTIEKTKTPWETAKIKLDSDGPQRRLIEYTLTMELQDGTRVAIDPPLDERGKGK